MSWYRRQLIDDITYWAPGAPDGYGGFAYTAQLLSGRWNSGQEVFYDSQGGEHRSTTVVHLEQSVVIHGWLAEGDHTGVTDPTTVSGAAEIQAVRPSKSITGRWHTFKALLQEEGQPG